MGNVSDEMGVNGIGGMSCGRMMKVDEIEVGVEVIWIVMVDDVVVGNGGKVGKVEMIDID